MGVCVVLFSRVYSNCSGPGFTLHSEIIVPCICSYGSKEQIEHFIPQMTAGKSICAIAVTEPEAAGEPLTAAYYLYIKMGG